MKYSFLICLLCLACKARLNDTLQGSLPGVYVRVINHEFAVGGDTLVVALLDEHTGTYSIVKKAGFVQYVNGKAVGQKNTTEKYTAVFDEPTGTLNDHHKMKTFTPVPEKGMLLSGSVAYKKVKND